MPYVILIYFKTLNEILKNVDKENNEGAVLLNYWFYIGPVICLRAVVLDPGPKAEDQYDCPQDISQDISNQLLNENFIW